MTRTDTILTTKTIAIVTALVVPMMLIPTSSSARSAQSEWGFLDRDAKVKYQRNTKADGDSLRRFFDGEAPSRNLKKSRQRNLSRHSRSTRANRNRRSGHGTRHYEDEIASTCVTPRQLHRRIHRQGWTHFHNLRIRFNVLIFKARQKHQSGESRELTYNLRVDKCSGALLKAKLQFRDRWFIRWMRRLSANN